jgi:O-antigen/teichoic acid export membrane protein
MSFKQTAIKGVFWSAIQNWGTQAVTFLVFTLLARLLEPKAFGLIALAGVFTAFVQIFLDRGFSVAIVQRKQIESDHLDTAFWTGVLIGLSMTIIGIMSAKAVAELFNEPDLALIVRWLSLVFTIRGFSSVQEAILQRNLNFKALAIRSGVAVVIAGIVATVMAFMGFGVWCLVAQQLINGLLQVLMLWSISDWRPKLKFSVPHFKSLFSFGINIVGIDLLTFLNRRSDDFLIGYFLGSTALGYYSIAYRLLLTGTQLLTGVLNQVAVPTFSKLQSEPEKIRKALYKVTFAASLISIPAFMGLGILASELIIVLFGQKWLPSIPVMQILASIGVLQSLFFLNGAVMTAVGKPSWRLKINFFSTIVSLVGFAIAVHYGIIAVASAFAIRNYLLCPLFVWIIYKLIKINIKQYLSQFIIPIFCSTTMCLILLLIKFLLADLIGLEQMLLLCILAGIAVYGLSIFIVKPELFKQTLKMTNTLVSVKVGKK